MKIQYHVLVIIKYVVDHIFENNSLVFIISYHSSNVISLLQHNQSSKKTSLLAKYSLLWYIDLPFTAFFIFSFMTYFSNKLQEISICFSHMLNLFLLLYAISVMLYILVMFRMSDSEEETKKMSGSDSSSSDSDSDNEAQNESLSKSSDNEQVNKIL